MPVWAPDWALDWAPGWAPTRPRHGLRIGPRSRPLTVPRTGSWIGPGSLGPGQDPRLDPGVAGLGPADWAPDWAPEFSSRPRKIFELISHCHMAISRANFWSFIGELVPRNPNLGIPALEDGLFANLLIFDYLYYTYINILMYLYIYPLFPLPKGLPPPRPPTKL